MGKLFDFNGDGHCSFSEEMFGLGLINMIRHETEQRDLARQAEPDDETEVETEE